MKIHQEWNKKSSYFFSYSSFVVAPFLYHKKKEEKRTDFLLSSMCLNNMTVEINYEQINLWEIKTSRKRRIKTEKKAFKKFQIYDYVLRFLSFKFSAALFNILCFSLYYFLLLLMFSYLQYFLRNICCNCASLQPLKIDSNIKVNTNWVIFLQL